MLILVIQELQCEENSTGTLLLTMRTVDVMGMGIYGLLHSTANAKTTQMSFGCC